MFCKTCYRIDTVLHVAFWAAFVELAQDLKVLGAFLVLGLCGRFALPFAKSYACGGPQEPAMSRKEKIIELLLSVALFASVYYTLHVAQVKHLGFAVSAVWILGIAGIYITVAPLLNAALKRFDSP